jgi:hypothetical protein
MGLFVWERVLGKNGKMPLLTSSIPLVGPPLLMKIICKVHFCDIREPRKARKFAREEIELLDDKIAVSEKGIAALVCGKKIRIVTLE